VSLPPYIDRATIHKRLQVIFPEGVTQRTWTVREAAASAVFTMLYIGAIEGTDQWLGPKHVMRMTEEQSQKAEEADRLTYVANVVKPRFRAEGTRWYEENSREQVRDESIRQGLIPNNAVMERSGLATTSNTPRYALRAEFASLFDPALDAAAFEKVATTWRTKHLSAASLARTVLLRRGTVTTGEGILVTFPNGETRRMAPGPSSVIAKAVIEEFAPRFLSNPAVLWVSESGAKVVKRDDELADQLKLKIAADRNLPDIILVDLGAGDAGQLLLVFIEVVATDGPITPPRQQALLKIATEAGFPAERVVFVTAYLARSHPAFKRTIPELAWRSFAWLAAEPEHIVLLHDGAASPLPLSTLIMR
jgi:hypothetical protein